MRADFGSARRLIANALWQTVLNLEQGSVEEYNEDYRGYFLKADVFSREE